MNIKNILTSWFSGMTHRQVRERHNLTPEQEFAITNCELSEAEIAERIGNVREGMTAKEIRRVMSGEEKA